MCLLHGIVWLCSRVSTINKATGIDYCVSTVIHGSCDYVDSCNVQPFPLGSPLLYRYRHPSYPEQASTMLKTISETIQAITVISHDTYIAC